MVGRRTLRSIYLSLLSVVFLTGISSSGPTDDAYAIYDRAREVWRSQEYPTVFHYRTTIDVSEGEKHEYEHFHGESFEGDVRVVGVSDEEQQTSHQAKGTNVKLTLTLGWNTGAGGGEGTMSADAHRKEASPDYLGVPLISPAYTFGLNSRQTDETTGLHGNAANAGKSLKTITTVTAIDRAYTISLTGTEAIGGLYAYHLRLVPIRNFDVFRLRDLWIDVYTYQVLKLRVQGNFTSSPMKGVPWTVTFQDVDGATYIASETAESDLVFPHDRIYTDARITFDDIESGDASTTILPNIDEAPALREPKSR